MGPRCDNSWEEKLPTRCLKQGDPGEITPRHDSEQYGIDHNSIAEESGTGSERLKLFACAVIHDLKSPSIGICGLARLLQKNYSQELGPRGAHICEQIFKASEQMINLLDAISIFTATRQLPLRIELINMEEVFCILRGEFSVRLEKRQVTLIEPKPAPLINADKLCMLRLFRNLIDNSLKHGGDGLTSITVGYEKFSSFHHFTLTDDGIGIHANDVANSLNKLHRATGIEGAGLGLTIVNEIAKLHKGEIQVKAGCSGKTVFHLFIPREQ